VKAAAGGSVPSDGRSLRATARKLPRLQRVDVGRKLICDLANVRQ
jgi:hypothetical protein